MSEANHKKKIFHLFWIQANPAFQHLIQVDVGKGVKESLRSTRNGNINLLIRKYIESDSSHSGVGITLSIIVFG